MGTCTTALKKICRKNKIKKWPYRQIRSITKSVQSLEMASMNDSLHEELRSQYREQIIALKKAIEDLIRDPNTPISLVNMKLGADDYDGNEDLDDEMTSSVNNATDNISNKNNINKSDGLAATNTAAWLQTIIPSNHGSNASLSSAANAVSSIVVSAGAGSSASGGGNTGTSPKSPTSSDAAQIMLAAAHTAGIEASSRHASSMIKRKGTSGGDPLHEEKDNESDPVSTVPLIGSTVVSQLSFANTGKHKILYNPPVALAALQRKKNLSTKKLVPLIEPDICNHFEMDFLPQSIIRSNKTVPPPQMQNYSERGLGTPSIDGASIATIADYANLNNSANITHTVTSGNSATTSGNSHDAANANAITNSNNGSNGNNIPIHSSQSL